MEISELSKNTEEIKKFQHMTGELERSEQILSKVTETNCKAKLESDFKAEVSSLDIQYKSKIPRYDESWAFLKHIGFLDLASNSNSKLKLLDESDKDLKQLLKFLDNDSTIRLSIKIGLIHVGLNQFNQKEILFNDRGSEKYEELLNYNGN